MERLSEKLCDLINEQDFCFDHNEFTLVNKALKKFKAYEDAEEQCIEENQCGLRELLMKWKAFFDDIAELYDYRAIGTVSEFKQLKEKATAKKPILNPICKCPICDHVLPYALVKYCSNCGTALDCSEGKEHTENSKWKESMMRTFLGSRK